MQKAKSVFVSLFITYSLAISVDAIYNITVNARWSWIGVLIASAPALLFFGFLFLKKTYKTSRKLGALSTLIYSGLVITFLVCWQLPDSCGYAPVFALISVIGWYLYIQWYSKFTERDHKLLVEGKKLPDFELEDETGKTISTKDFRGHKVIYLFYRGNWCPLCMAHISEIADQYKRLAKMGAKIVLISPQSQKHTQDLSKKFEVPFIFLVDKEHKLSKQLEIFQANGTPFGMEVFGYESDTVLPTLIITDENGQIIYLDLTDNYRLRPEPETFIKVLQENE